MIGYSTKKEIQTKFECNEYIAKLIWKEARKLARENGVRIFNGYAPNMYLNDFCGFYLFHEPKRKELLSSDD